MQKHFLLHSLMIPPTWDMKTLHQIMTYSQVNCFEHFLSVIPVLISSRRCKKRPGRTLPCRRRTATAQPLQRRLRCPIFTVVEEISSFWMFMEATTSNVSLPSAFRCIARGYRTQQISTSELMDVMHTYIIVLGERGFVTHLNDFRLSHLQALM